MRIRVICLLTTCCMSLRGENGIIPSDSLIAPNQIAAYQHQKLILIDFWATWCRPCVAATTQLEILQESVSDLMYMISLSDESAQTIGEYLIKHPIKLAVVSDHNHMNFHRYSVVSRPYAVILDYTGKLVWSGRPYDLNVSEILKLHHSVKGTNKKELNEILERVAAPSQELKKPMMAETNPGFHMEWVPECIERPFVRNCFYSFCGTLSQFVLNHVKIAEYQLENRLINQRKLFIQIPLNTKGYFDSNTLRDSAMSRLCFKLEKGQKPFPVKEMIVYKPGMLWDTAQISWPKDGPKYMLGTSRVQADNVTIREMADILSLITKDPYLYSGSDTQSYDWDFTYTIESLMNEELESSFGIRLKKKTMELDYYRLTDTASKADN